ncbi:flagellar hook-length control protein FliK [Allopusillimonas soli]|uniref:Flagellar hook-length control protein FliK n=1 Tax=Allopusillimonas soli TaxID=659016 RepID=A0A853FA93_9BURK|nr:flagellar hook-length control protein FliK [Allopusillimonas soli]NYT35501.1 flagellar hook-length control protein FliK [Allopusillimonas soli]TEA75912.1 flagellar hook-length control protein FliK [Allopusillimonas soli]
MTAGPSGLGTLLVQRLDAMLGTTLSQQMNLANGARPDAVRQPAQSESTPPGRNEIRRHPQEAVDQIQGRQQPSRDARSLDLQRTGPGDQAPLRMPSATSSAATPSAPTTLGAAARIILALLTRFPESAAAVQRSQPLLRPADQGFSQPERISTPGPQGRAEPVSTSPSRMQAMAPSGADAPLREAFAAALSRALKHSGLFYESHLALLAQGKADIAQLRQEPQGQQAVRNPGTGGVQDMPLPVQHLVRQQLEALANQTFAWQGLAWPGVPLSWTLQRHTDTPAHEAARSDHWHTALDLALPELGAIQIRLILRGDSLDVSLQADQSATLLGRHASTLRAHCAELGLTVGRLSIKRGAAHESA